MLYNCINHDHVASYDVICSVDCGRLIQKMLQTDPNKRLSLAKVLKDEWMRKGSTTTTTTTGVITHSNQSNITSTHSNQSNRLSDDNGSIQWNEHVLQIMKNMSYNIEETKQVSLVMQLS